MKKLPDMPDWMKTAMLMLTLLGGTNGVQYLGVTAPVKEQKAELTVENTGLILALQTAQETYRSLYNQCLDDLRICRSECNK